MNDVLTQQTDIFAIVVHVGLENHMRRICLQHTIAKVQIRKRCFFDLEIGKTEDFKKHLNKYDVIHIDVQWFLTNCEEAENVVAYITRIVLDELREIYPEILSEDVRSLPDGLSRVKDKTGQKFIIIIDEWDVLIGMSRQIRKYRMNISVS